MPNSLVVPGLQAGTELASQAINAITTASQNRQSRAFSREMYDRQRQAALDDWAMQNEYNSPSSQMARLREAGLNPNLVYGNGGAESKAGPVRSSDAPAAQFVPAKFDLGGAFNRGLGAYYDTQIKQAQIDNLKSQNTVLTQDAALKAAQVIATLAAGENTKQNTETSKFDLLYKSELRETSMDVVRQQLEKLRAETTTMLDENERRAALQAPTLSKAAEEILNLRLSRAKTNADIDLIRQQIINLKKDENLKQLDVDLKEKGIQPSDAIYWRVLARLLDGSALNDFKDGGKVDTQRRMEHLRIFAQDGPYMSGTIKRWLGF